MGNQVAGGVVAYQFCFVAFLAPYAILAQPIHTTILPELTHRRRRATTWPRSPAGCGGVSTACRASCCRSARRSSPSRCPAMRVLAVGNSRHDADLFAAALASLGVGPVHLRHVPVLRARVVRARRQPHARDHRRRVSALVGAGGDGRGRPHVREPTPPRSPRSASGTARRTSSARSRSGWCCARASATGSSRTRSCPRWRRRPRSAALAWLVEHLVAPSGRLADLLVLVAIGLVGARSLRAAPAHAAQAWRPARAGVRTHRSRPRGRAVMHRR